jgi:predicted negative regulator of RcsB-dependent stress response
VTIPRHSKDSEPLSALLAGAIEAAKRDDKEAAIAQLKQVLEAEPRHEVAAGMLASLYAELGLVERAMRQFQQVLEHHPENVLARFQLGVLQLTAHQPQQALDTLQAMLSMEGEFLAHFYSGQACIELGQAAPARSLFQRAAERMPPTHPLQEHLQAMLKSTG